MMGAKPHICSGPECPCYQCSACKKRWAQKHMLKKHQLFGECKLKLTEEQKQLDQRQDAARPVEAGHGSVGPAAVPGPAGPVPAPGLLQGDQQEAPRKDGQHSNQHCCTLQVLLHAVRL